jgi:hypothetical protein
MCRVLHDIEFVLHSMYVCGSAGRCMVAWQWAGRAGAYGNGERINGNVPHGVEGADF